MIAHVLAYTPFVDPLPIWVRNWFWSTLLIPLCLIVSVVYKTIKCRYVSQIPRESGVLFVTIVLFMIVAAGVLSAVTSFVR